MAITKRYALGEYELEPDSFSLNREQTPVPISRKRFQILLYLIEQRHKVVTRQELVARCWDAPEVYEENLTKTISEIRRALDDQQKPHRCIETLPAIGYRYIGPVEERERTESLPGTDLTEASPAPDEASWQTVEPTVALQSSAGSWRT